VRRVDGEADDAVEALVGAGIAEGLPTLVRATGTGFQTGDSHECLLGAAR
jgi:hypothetical protein